MNNSIPTHPTDAKPELPNTREGKLLCHPENAHLYKKWIAERGGLALWASKLIGEPLKSWTAPLRRANSDTVSSPPHWSCGAADAKPDAIFTKEEDVLVELTKELARVDTPYNSNGHLSAQFTKKLKALDAEHPNCYWVMNTDGSASIVVPDSYVPLNTFPTTDALYDSATR